jgi:RimJ/RimL family protein N-acetyltransferase
MEKIILKTKRLNLRTIKITDAVEYSKWLNDDEVIKYLGSQDKPSLVEEKKIIREKLKLNDKLNLTIVLNNKPIGFSNLKFFPADSAVKIGLTIGDKSKWGNGFGPEVLKFIIDWLFVKKKFNRIQLEVFEDNKKAYKIYKKLGFKREGKRRMCHWNKITKKYDNEIIMSILKSEYKK